MKYKATIEQIIYNGPVEYAYDVRWSVRDMYREIVNVGTSSSIDWAETDCIVGLETLDVEICFDILPVAIVADFRTSGPFVYREGTVDWPDDCQAWIVSPLNPNVIRNRISNPYHDAFRKLEAIVAATRPVS